MTNEEKSILLKDLCARLPYGVIIECGTDYDFQHDITDTCELLSVNIDNELCEIQTLDKNRYVFNEQLDTIKPYLRPMSSMTEEEKKEFTKVLVKSQDCSYENNESSTTIVNDWYLSKGFDVRGLIPKGLALEIKKGMYK